MDFDMSLNSPMSQRSNKSPDHQNTPHLKLRSSSFSSQKSFNWGQNNSPQSKEQDNIYVLNETKKLLQRGKYKKAFINLRRYLMDQELSKSVQIDFYSQIIHVCHKIVKKYFKKSTTKILNKVPPLMSVIYQYLNQWESFLVSLQNEANCKDQVFSKQASAQEQVLLKKQSIMQKDLQEAKNTTYKQSQFQQTHQKQSTFQKNFSDEVQKNDLERNQQNKTSQNNQISEIEFDQVQKLGGDEEQDQEEDQEDKYDPLIIIKDKFHLHREQMLNQYLRSLYLSSQFHKQVNQPMRSLKFLMKGSEIVRDFLSNLLFISSADLSHIAATIELTRGNIHLEQNQIDEAILAFEYAFQMERNAIEIWFKKLGSFSKQDIPIKFEIKCEKCITQLVLILLVKTSCFEILNKFSKALETIQLANWFSSKLLLYESSSQLKQTIENYYNFVKEKYEDLLLEEAEIQKILRSFDQSKANYIEQKQKEDTNRKQKLIDDLNAYLYNKADCENLNKNLKILIKKPIPNQNQKDDYNISLQLISSSENIHQIDDQITKQGQDPQQPRSFSQLFNTNNHSHLHQGQKKESVKNYLSISNLKVYNNKSLSEIPSFQDQTTHITGLQASKLYGIQNSQLNRSNQNKAKSFREGFNINNIIDNTYLESGQTSQQNIKRQSFSTHGIDLQSIINFDQNNVNPYINRNSEDQKMNSSFNNQGNFISPIAFSQNKTLINQKNLNSGNNSINSSFMGLNNQFNSNNGVNLQLTDAFQNSSANAYMGNSPRVQLDSSQINSDNQNLSHNQNFQNKLYQRINSFSQDLVKFNNELNSEKQIKSEAIQIENRQKRNSSLQFNKENNVKSPNLSLNQKDLDNYQQNESNPLFLQKNVNNNYLHVNQGNNQSLGSQVSINQKFNQYNIYPTLNNMSNMSKSSTRLNTNKRKTRMTQSQSKITSFNQFNPSQKQNQHKKRDDNKKHKVITSELYFNQEPPKFQEEPEQIEQLKQKYKFMRDDEDDVKEQKQKQEIKYKFMKIPLDQRRDLIDLDICMKKVILEQLTSEADHTNYPYMHWLCGKTLQQANMDKKELQFSNIMVQFKQKNGNGKSIPSIQQKEDTTISIQREIKQFNEQSTISRIKEKIRYNQLGNSLHDSQAFQKVLNLNKSKPENQQPIKSEHPVDVETKQDFNISMRSKMIKAAQMQKQIDEASNGMLSDKNQDKKRATSLLGSFQESTQNQKAKNRSNFSEHKMSKSDQNAKIDNQTEQCIEQQTHSEQIEKADYALKQIVLSNEQEREKINKQIENLQSKHTKIGMKELVKTLAKKEQDSSLLPKTYFSQKQNSNLNQNSAYDEDNETGITHSDDEIEEKISKNNSRHQKMKDKIKTQKQESFQDKILTSSKSFNQINPNYFNFTYLKKEFGDQLYSSDNKQSNIAFEVDKFLNLASSTKHLSQQKMFKQNQFSFADTALLAKLKNLDNNGGNSTKNANKNGKPQVSMPRRYTLLAQQKNN